MRRLRNRVGVAARSAKEFPLVINELLLASTTGTNNATYRRGGAANSLKGSPEAQARFRTGGGIAEPSRSLLGQSRDIETTE